MHNIITLLRLLFLLWIASGPVAAQEFGTSLHPLGEAVSGNDDQETERVFPSNIHSVSSAAFFMPPPGNDNCANATLLTPNNACTAGTLVSSGVQSGENTSTGGHCGASNFNMSVWYKFTATSSTMWVQSYITGLAGGGGGYYPTRYTSVVYNTGSCQPTNANRISCSTMNTIGSGDGIATNSLTGLTIGDSYLIQIGYNNGNGSQDPLFCIRIGDQFSPNCTTCSTNCGQACGFPTAPTAAQVTAACVQYPYTPYIEGGQVSTRCHSFIANNSTVSFQVIVNTTCGVGNVSNFTWSLYSAACSAPIQTGTLAGMTFTGLSIGQSYVYCYNYTVPSGCYHTIHYPYFVGAAPLPIELISFIANSRKDLLVDLTWITASEINNRLFEIERSHDGTNYVSVHSTSGAGTSITPKTYKHTDRVPASGTYYYRLKQTDYNGDKSFSDPLAINITGKQQISFQPNPVQDELLVTMRSESVSQILITVFNQHGKPVMEQHRKISTGIQQIPLSMGSLPGGVYSVRVESGSETYVQRIIKL
jgi:hypothetical protein